MPLNDSDTIYADIRDLSIERLGGYLQDKAIAIKQKYATFRDNKDASIAEIHDFVKRLPSLTKEYKALYQHINIAELLKKTTDSPAFREQWQGERGMLEGESYLDAIEELICADVERQHLYKALRLLCLQSLTAGGVRSNRYDALRRLLVQTYGYDTLFLLASLEKAALLKRRELLTLDAAPVWQGICRQLKLVTEGDEDPAAIRNSIAYVTAGYAPLSARLVENLGRAAGWRGMSDVLRLLPGPMLDFTQGSRPEELADALRRSADSSAHLHSQVADMDAGGIMGAGQADRDGDDGDGSSSSGGSGHGSKKGKKVLLLLMVGGLSFLEVAALRHLSRDPRYPFHIVMASTKLCNGSQLLQSAGGVLPPSLLPQQ